MLQQRQLRRKNDDNTTTHNSITLFKALILLLAGLFGGAAFTQLQEALGRMENQDVPQLDKAASREAAQFGSSESSLRVEETITEDSTDRKEIKSSSFAKMNEQEDALLISYAGNGIPKATPSSPEDKPVLIKIPLPPNLCTDSLSNSKACHFVEERRQLYQAQNKSQMWRLRGNGYLAHRHGMILEATLPKELKQGENIITIQDILTPSRTNCYQFTLWIRVNGPELFAGKPTPVPTLDGCHWEFVFDLRANGTYTVDAKALLWYGVDSRETNACSGDRIPMNAQNKPELPPNVTDQFPIHAGFQAFKLYHPQSMCCEVCARIPSCRYWASPAINIVKPERRENGCELFFEKDADPDDIPISMWLPNQGQPLQDDEAVAIWHNYNKKHDRTEGYWHGAPVRTPEQTSYYIGCGWSYWFTADYPCLSGELDDQIFMANNRFEFDYQPQQGVSNQSISTTPERVCTLQDEKESTGRWVRRPFHDPNCPQFKMVNTKKRFWTPEFVPDRPQCYHRDNIQQVGNTQHEPRHYKWLSPDSKWLSSLQQETEFNGVYQNDNCHYREFANDQLQQCITKRKITKITTAGRSISEFTLEFLNVRLKDITLWDESDPNALTITLDTLGLAHYAWDSTDYLIRDMKERPVVNATDEHYWMTGFFLTSERELVGVQYLLWCQAAGRFFMFHKSTHDVSFCLRLQHCDAQKMLEFQSIVPGILEPKGYKMIEAFNVTAAFAWEVGLLRAAMIDCGTIKLSRTVSTSIRSQFANEILRLCCRCFYRQVAAQFDGLHFLGPPIKMIVTKLFHHICAGLVEGSPV